MIEEIVKIVIKRATISSNRLEPFKQLVVSCWCVWCCGCFFLISSIDRERCTDNNRVNGNDVTIDAEPVNKRYTPIFLQLFKFVCACRARALARSSLTRCCSRFHCFAFAHNNHSLHRVECANSVPIPAYLLYFGRGKFFVKISIAPKQQIQFSTSNRTMKTLF